MSESSQANTGKFTKEQVFSKVSKVFKRKDEKGLTTQKVNSMSSFLDNIEKGEIVATQTKNSQEQGLEQ